MPRPIGPRLHEVLSASTSGRLHQLDLSRNRLGTDLMHTLAGAPRLQTLEHLALSLDEAEGRTLVEAAPRWPLRSLQLAALDALAADTVGAVLSAFDTVDTLRLEVGRRAAPAWLEVMVSAPVAEHLTTLDLSGVAIGTHGASVLGDAVLPELTTLSLDGAELSAPALSALSSGAGLAALQRLRLSNNRFGPIGVAALARASWAGRVTHLDLRHCALGDAGARRLADSGLLEQVVELDLTLNRLGDDGALAVVDALVRRGRTGRVDLRNNPILEAGRQAVHQRAAGCEGLEVIV